MLIFPSVDKLVRFRIAVDPKVLEVTFKTRTICCYCTEEEAELASYVYDAVILELQSPLN